MKHTSNQIILQKLAGTKYADLSGLVEIDGHDGISGFYKLLEENNINTHDYFLIGIGFSDTSIQGIGSHQKVCCKVLLLETGKYGHSFEEIKSHLILNSTIDVIKKSFFIDYDQLKKHLKRMDMMLLTGMGNYIREMRIHEDERVDEQRCK